MAFPGFLKRMKKIAGGVVKGARFINEKYKQFKPIVDAAVSSIPVAGNAIATGLNYASGFADKALPYADELVEWIPENEDQWEDRKNKFQEFTSRERAQRQLM